MEKENLLSQEKEQQQQQKQEEELQLSKQQISPHLSNQQSSHHNDFSTNQIFLQQPQDKTLNTGGFILPSFNTDFSVFEQQCIPSGVQDAHQDNSKFDNTSFLNDFSFPTSLQQFPPGFTFSNSPIAPGSSSRTGNPAGNIYHLIFRFQ